MKKHSRGENGVQDEHKESCLKDSARELVRLMFKGFVQYRIERNDQKALQSLIDQIKPLHLADNIEYPVLIAFGYQKGPDGLINGRNERKETQSDL